jgi:hypothetical protein
MNLRHLRQAACLLCLVPLALPAAPSLESKQLTFGPKHHFFGYIGHVQNIPWNKSGRYIVALQTGFQDHMPGATEAADIILIDTQHDNTVRVIERTLAWNPQQGTMLYWNPDAPETQFFFNDRDPKTGKVFCVLFDIGSEGSGRRVREYRFDDTPVGNSGVAQKGGWFYAINYARMARLRPVTGYPETFDWTRGVHHPADDGVFRVEVATGKKQLLVSFQQLADAVRPLRPDVAEKDLFINHTLANRDNDRVFFFVRGDFDFPDRRVNEAFIMHPDGTGLTPMKFIGGHPEWDLGHRMIGAVGKDQVLFDTDRQEIVGAIGSQKIITEPGGDIALSPDGRWLVNGGRTKGVDYYVFVRRSDNVSVRSGGFDVNPWISGDLRCDPAPCWNRQSDQIVFPAIAPDKTRQMFTIRLRP